MLDATTSHTQQLLTPGLRQTILLLMREHPHIHVTMVVYHDTFTGRIRAALEIRKWAARKWIPWAAAKNQIRSVYSAPPTGQPYFVFGFRVDN